MAQEEQKTQSVTEDQTVPSPCRDLIFGAIDTAQAASKGTKQLEKSKEIVTHAAQLKKTLENWADPRNNRAAHTVKNLVQAFNRASSVNWDDSKLKLAIPESEWSNMLALYRQWETATVNVVMKHVIAPVDELEGKTSASTQKAVLSKLDQLGMELVQAVKDKDKKRQNDLMRLIAATETSE